MSELKPCPFCGGEARVMQYGEQEYLPTCNDCHCILDYCFLCEEDAVETWNRRTQPKGVEIDTVKPVEIDQFKNAPLTLEELRGMDGPVWVCYQQETWGPQHPNADNLTCSRYKFTFDNYGKTWLAYRRKPESEGGDR
jgi:hypothetical protein